MAASHAAPTPPERSLDGIASAWPEEFIIFRPSGSDHPFRLAWTAVDTGVWVFALVIASWLRYESYSAPIEWGGFWIAAAIVAAAQLIVGFAWGPYAIGHMRGSYEEILDVVKTVVVAAIGLCIPVLLIRPTLVPKSVPMIAAPFAMVGMLGLRLLVREWKARNGHALRKNRIAEPQRLIIFGAGEGGRLLARAIARDPHRSYVAVALLDDDPRKARLSLEGVRVKGTRKDLERLAEYHDADILAIAIPTAGPELIADLSERAERAGLDVLTLPPVTDMISSPSLGDLRDLDLADLLGRRAISLDTTAIADLISGKRVLVTGAGGSIGSELCRQIKKFGPAQLYALDRDESALHAVQLSMDGSGLFEDDSSVLNDIRDLPALRSVFHRIKPDIVFHAAALKHLPMLERFPLEGYKSNVIGTLNVLTAAAETRVSTVVNISTDKAADPTSMLGYTKRVAERLTAGFAHHHPGRFVSVRFGNVLGSRGSVVHAFTAQIQRGGPVLVTHPDVERYFMLIPEACQLVLEAANAAVDRGEVMVLDMGTPQKIVNVAKALIRMSGRRNVEIHFTGLRPGEKMSEDLVAHAEDARLTKNALVTGARVAPLHPDSIPAEDIIDDHTAYQWCRSAALSVDKHAPSVQS